MSTAKAVAKRLARHEAEVGIESEDFFARHTRGDAGDDTSAVDWANDSRHVLAPRAELDARCMKLLSRLEHYLAGIEAA
jgi:hypothetical protein